MCTNAGIDYVAHDGKIDKELMASVLAHGLAPPRTVVFCLGGFGTRTARAIAEAELPNTQVVVVNCDEQGMTYAEADTKLLIGRTVTFGRDAGGFPEVGERCFDMAEEEIRDSLESNDVVYIIAGLGGGLGTGVAPHVAKVAKEDGMAVISLVYTPFSFEDRDETRVQGAINELSKYSDSTVVRSNDELMFKPTMPVNRAMAMADRTIVDTIRLSTQLMEIENMKAIVDEELPRLLSHMVEVEEKTPAKEKNIAEESEEELQTEMLVAA